MHATVNTQEAGEWSTILTHPRPVRARWLPSPAAEIEVCPGRWERTIPDGRIAWLDPQQDAYSPQWSKTPVPGVPPAIATRIAPFPSHQWALGVLLHHEPLATDLADANPVLAYALGNNYILRRTPEETNLANGRREARHKQRDILKWLGFPATEAAVRLFRKLVPSAVDPLILLRLRAAISNRPDTMALLAHHPVITDDMLDIITRPELRSLVSHQLLEDIAHRHNPHPYDPISTRLLMIRELSAQLRVPLPASPLLSIAGVLRCLNGLDEVAARRHEEAMRLAMAPARRPHASRKLRRKMPQPPIAGTDTIVPLSTRQALIDEGIAMRHCVGAMVDAVLAGDLYCYRVLAPERATLAIAPATGNQWRVFDLKGRRNAAVKPETQTAVRTWLYQRPAA